MVRYLLAGAAAISLLSGAALAQDIGYDGGSKTVISRPDGSRTVIKRHVNRYGALVTKRKTMDEGFSGSSTVTRTRRAIDPVTGETTIHSRTFER